MVEKIQFSGAVQEIQTLFFDVYAKFENFEAESQKQNDAIQTLKNELKYSEKKRAEITAKYSNLRVSHQFILCSELLRGQQSSFQVKYERLRTSIKEAMTLNSPTPDQMEKSVSRLREKFDLEEELRSEKSSMKSSPNKSPVASD